MSDPSTERVTELTARISDLEQQLREARRALETEELRAQRMTGEYVRRIRELEQLTSTLSGGLAQTRDDLYRAEGSRAWRWGHGVTRALSRVARRHHITEGALAEALKRIAVIEDTTGALPKPLDPLEDRPPSVKAQPESIAPADDRGETARSAARAELAAEIRSRLGPVPERESWPGVSVIVSAADPERLESLTRDLAERTDYPELEVVTAVERASHDLLLFLDPGVEPFEAGWLRELVAARDGDGVAATGATLLRSEAGNDPEWRDRTVRSRSIKFQARSGAVLPFDAAEGEDLFGAGFGVEDRAPAVTGECLLIDRASFEGAGGFSQAHRDGTGDVDLSLRLTASGGTVIATGRSIAYSDSRLGNGSVDRRAFLERWGPRVRREYRLGRLLRDAVWTDGQGPRIAITVTSIDPEDSWGAWYAGYEMGDALASLGWRVSYIDGADDVAELPEDLDYLLSTVDAFDLRQVPEGVTAIAWVRNSTERWLERGWFDRADVILTTSRASAESIELATGRTAVLFPHATNATLFASQPPDQRLAADYVFAANQWGKERDIQAGLEVREDERLDIYGMGWDAVPELATHARGVAPYEELGGIYASAKLVLDDTPDSALRYGAVNGRVFDALAAGTLPITNCEAGVRELFDDEFPTWSTATGLREQLDALLGDDGHREALAQRYRSEVLAHHTYGHRAEQLTEVLREHEEKLSFCIKIGAPNWKRAERWGDLYFARALARALGSRGHRCLIQVLDEWDDVEGLSYDVALVIKGMNHHHPKPGQLNVLWSISHPAELTGEECNGYDLVCVASERFAAALREQTKTPVIVLEQATDPSVFYPDPSPDYEHELVYVANSRSVLRPIVRDLLPTEHDLAVYGEKWEGLIDTRYVVAEHVPNDELRKVYSSAKLVLCDHWDDMREHGFVSNRVYDALACGATVISDEVAGLKGRFGDAVITYRTADELRELVRSRLEEGGGPANRTSSLPEGSTFEMRIERLLDQIGRLENAEDPLVSSAVQS